MKRITGSVGFSLLLLSSATALALAGCTSRCCPSRCDPCAGPAAGPPVATAPPPPAGPAAAPSGAAGLVCGSSGSQAPPAGGGRTASTDTTDSATTTLLSVVDVKTEPKGSAGPNTVHVTLKPTDTTTFSCVLHFPVKTKDEVNFLKLTLKNGEGKEEGFVRKIESSDDWAKIEAELMSKDGLVWTVTPTLAGPYKEVRVWYKFAVLKGVDLIEGRSINRDAETAPTGAAPSGG